MTKERSVSASRAANDAVAWADDRDGSDASGAEAVRMSGQEQAGIVPEMTALIAECYKLHGRLTTVFSTVKELGGISRMESTTLYAIVNSGKPVTVPQIGRALGHARQVIQRAARELEQRGLVETRDNPGHKRAAFLVPTAAGHELKRDLDRAANEVSRSLVGGLDIATIRATYAGLNKLRRNVEQRDRDLNSRALRKKK